MDEFDIVIVGSGAGGAPIAHQLAKANKRVLVLEKGPLFRQQSATAGRLSDFKRDELFATGSEKRILHKGVENSENSFYSSHVEPDLNDEPHVFRSSNLKDYITMEGYTAQVVGGGTQLYGGVSLRFAPNDFKLATFNAGRSNNGDPNGDIQKEARDWPFDYDTLEPYYRKAEDLIGINGDSHGQEKHFNHGVAYQTPPSPNPISEYITKGMDALGMKRYRTPLAVITEAHLPSNRSAPQGPRGPKTGYVNRFGDPMGFKSNTWVSLLEPVSNLANFELRANCIVTGMSYNNHRITEVKYLDPLGMEKRVKAKVFVIACSAIETVRLLKLCIKEDPNLEPLINPHGLLGAYFLTHCFGGAETRVPLRFDKSISLDSDWATDHCSLNKYLDDHQLWAGATLYNNTSDQALPISLARNHESADMDTNWKYFVDTASITGEKLAGFMKADFGRRLSISYMANQVPVRTNRIELHPTIMDKWGRPCACIIKDWHPHDKYLMDTLANQCREILKAGVKEFVPDFDAVTTSGSAHNADLGASRIANHILGGARFGTQRADSVLDPDCKVWDLDNLYVTDGAFMPTSGGANPTLTIQANAFRVAELLKGRC